MKGGRSYNEVEENSPTPFSDRRAKLISSNARYPVYMVYLEDARELEFKLNAARATIASLRRELNHLRPKSDKSKMKVQKRKKRGS